jgi:hypothetical protein
MEQVKRDPTKAAKAKIKKMLSKYNWIIAEPYYDTVIDNGSTGKSKTFITLRQFKERIDEGQSLKAMKGEGVSKHLIQFFSNFLQGKIKLTKSDFEDRYNEGKELDEICAEFNVQRGDLTYLRQLYGIKRKGATFIKRKKTEEPLTQIQKDLIYGSLMGDAKSQNNKWNTSVGFGHGRTQKEYVEWKHSLLKNISTPKGITKYSYYDERYKKDYDTYRFYTLANSDVEEILHKFYTSDGKQINNDILDHLSAFSIAVWYMDDGYADKGKYGITNYIFCTDSFSSESCDNIVKWFDEKWGIKSHKRERQLSDRIGYRIVIRAESRDRFISLVEPHLIPSLRYKIEL